MQSRHTTGTARALGLALVAALAAIIFASTAEMQVSKPIKRKGLVDAIKINSLSTAELVKFIQRRGVDFEMTADAEAELRSVGARPEVVEQSEAATVVRPPGTTRRESRNRSRVHEDDLPGRRSGGASIDLGADARAPPRR